MSLFDRIRSILDSPSRRKGIDYTKAISDEAKTGVLLLLYRKRPVKYILRRGKARPELMVDWVCGIARTAPHRNAHTFYTNNVSNGLTSYWHTGSAQDSYNLLCTIHLREYVIPIIDTLEIYLGYLWACRAV